MSKIDWTKKIGWSEEQLEDLRHAGFAYIRQGKYDVALPIFEGLIVLDPNSTYDAQTLGAIYLELKKPEEAAKILEKALMLDGEHASTLLNYCKALFMLGKKEEGLKLADILKNEKDVLISNSAWALLLAHQ